MIVAIIKILYYVGETFDPDEDSFVKKTKKNKKGIVHKHEKYQLHNLKKCCKV